MMRFMRFTSKRRVGLSKAGVAIVVVVLAVVGGVAVLYLPALSGGTTTTSNTGANTSTSQSLVAMVIIPKGVGADQTLNFRPSKITVVIGVNNTIQWIQQDSTPHNVMSSSVPIGAQSFRSDTVMSEGSKFKVTLTVPGTYRYMCSIHPTYMLGEIVVLSR